MDLTPLSFLIILLSVCHVSHGQVTRGSVENSQPSLGTWSYLEGPTPATTLTELSNNKDSCSTSGVSSCGVYIPPDLIPPNYNPFEHPPGKRSNDSLNRLEPLEVRIDMHLIQIPNLDEGQEVIQMETSFAVRWWDSRLDPFIEKHPQKAHFLLDARIMDGGQIWRPYIYLDQLASNDKPALLAVPFELSINQDHSNSPFIFFSFRSYIKTACDMDYTFYPVDVTNCAVDIRSYLYTEDQLVLHWTRNATVTTEKNVDVPGFKVYVYNGTEGTFTNSVGRNYSTLSFNIVLKRLIGYSIIQIYVPSFIFVLICFASFLIDNIKERIACATVSLLSLLVMLGTIGQAIPTVTYLTALHVWMIVCIVLVIIPLFQGFIYTKLKKMQKLARKREARVMKDLRRKSYFSQRDSTPDVSAEEPTELKEKESERLGRIAKRFHQIPPIMVMLVFVVFNCVYWPWLFNGNPVDHNNLIYETGS